MEISQSSKYATLGCNHFISTYSNNLSKYSANNLQQVWSAQIHFRGFLLEGKITCTSFATKSCHQGTGQSIYHSTTMDVSCLISFSHCMYVTCCRGTKTIRVVYTSSIKTIEQGHPPYAGGYERSDPTRLLLFHQQIAILLTKHQGQW